MTFSNGINAPKENYGTGTKMISVMDILNPLPIKYDNILNSVAVDKKIEDKNKVEKGDLIFVRSSEIVEEVGWAKAYKEDRYALYSGFAIRGKRISSYNAYFIELTLNYANRKEVERRAGGSTRFNVSQEILNSLTVLTPLISEQNQIDLFFTKIDNTIALHQRKLEKLKRLKQGYLQQLFPQNDEKVPRVRFANFENELKQRKLGEISRMYQPLTITGNDLLPDGVPVFGANGFIGFFSEANHIDDQVTISARGEGTGTPSYVHGPVWITGNSMVVNVDDFDIDKYFLFANLTANSLKKYVTGGAQPQLTRDVLVKVPITLPNADEQEKIGSFFKQLDETITLHHSKLDKLNLLKQALLQKMFI